jgi:hypothetical protein
MPNRLAGLLVAATATMALSASVDLAGCYSWQLGTSPDGGVPVDATTRDAHHRDAGKERPDATDATDAGKRSVDASDAASPEPDVHASTDSSRPPADAGRDRQVDAGTCGALEEAADAARILAEECPALSKACDDFVLDRCHCRVFVGAADSGATASFQRVVATEVEAGCAQDCVPCPAADKCAWCLDTKAGLLCTPCAPPGCTCP